jgi:peptidoglycan hydrolase-like protein with peptidoglycan-binding domain
MAKIELAAPKYQNKKGNIIASAIAGTLLLVFLAAIVFALPEPTDLQRSILRFFISLTAAFAATFLLGGVALHGRVAGMEVGASGGFCLFILSQFLIDPFGLQQAVADGIPSAMHPQIQLTEIQILLRDLNYYTGQPNGLPGSATRLAIRAFQIDHDLKPTGYLDPLTRKAIDDTKPGRITPTSPSPPAVSGNDRIGIPNPIMPEKFVFRDHSAEVTYDKGPVAPPKEIPKAATPPIPHAALQSTNTQSPEATTATASEQYCATVIGSAVVATYAFQVNKSVACDLSQLPSPEPREVRTWMTVGSDGRVGIQMDPFRAMMSVVLKSRVDVQLQYPQCTPFLVMLPDLYELRNTADLPWQRIVSPLDGAEPDFLSDSKFAESWFNGLVPKSERAATLAAEIGEASARIAYIDGGGVIRSVALNFLDAVISNPPDIVDGISERGRRPFDARLTKALVEQWLRLHGEATSKHQLIVTGSFLESVARFSDRKPMESGYIAIPASDLKRFAQALDSIEAFYPGHSSASVLDLPSSLGYGTLSGSNMSALKVGLAVLTQLNPEIVQSRGVRYARSSDWLKTYLLRRVAKWNMRC